MGDAAIDVRPLRPRQSLRMILIIDGREPMIDLASVRRLGAILIVGMCAVLLGSCYTQYAPATERTTERRSATPARADLERDRRQAKAEEEGERDGETTTYADEYRRSNRYDQQDGRNAREPRMREGTAEGSRGTVDSGPTEVNYHFYGGPHPFPGFLQPRVVYQPVPVIIERPIWRGPTIGRSFGHRRPYRSGYWRRGSYRDRFVGGVGVSLDLYFDGGLLSLQVGYESSFARRSLVCSSYEYYYQSRRYRFGYSGGVGGPGGAVGWRGGFRPSAVSGDVATWGVGGGTMGRTTVQSSGRARSRVDTGRRADRRVEGSGARTTRRDADGAVARPRGRSAVGRIGRVDTRQERNSKGSARRERSGRVAASEKEEQTRRQEESRRHGRIGRASSTRRSGNDPRRSRAVGAERTTEGGEDRGATSEGDDERGRIGRSMSEGDRARSTARARSTRRSRSSGRTRVSNRRRLESEEAVGGAKRGRRSLGRGRIGDPSDEEVGTERGQVNTRGGDRTRRFAERRQGRGVKRGERRDLTGQVRERRGAGPSVHRQGPLRLRGREASQGDRGKARSRKTWVFKNRGTKRKIEGTRQRDRPRRHAHRRARVGHSGGNPAPRRRGVRRGKKHHESKAAARKASGRARTDRESRGQRPVRRNGDSSEARSQTKERGSERSRSRSSETDNE
jgi:hypothetical protein